MLKLCCIFFLFLCIVSECVTSITISAANSRDFLLQPPHYEFYSSNILPQNKIVHNSFQNPQLRLNASSFTSGNYTYFVVVTNFFGKSSSASFTLKKSNYQAPLITILGASQVERSKSFQLRAETKLFSCEGILFDRKNVQFFYSWSVNPRIHVCV